MKLFVCFVALVECAIFEPRRMSIFESRLFFTINLYSIIMKLLIFFYESWASCYFHITFVPLYLCLCVYLYTVVLFVILSLSKPTFSSLYHQGPMSNIYVYIYRYVNNIMIEFQLVKEALQGNLWQSKFRKVTKYDLYIFFFFNFPNCEYFLT